MTRAVRIGNVILNLKKFNELISKDLEKEAALANINISDPNAPYWRDNKVNFLFHLRALLNADTTAKRVNGDWVQVNIQKKDIIKKPLLFEYDVWEGIEVFDLKINLGKSVNPGINDMLSCLNGGLKGRGEHETKYAVEDFKNTFKRKTRSYVIKVNGRQMNLNINYLNCYKPIAKFRKTIKTLKDIKSEFISFEFNDEIKNFSKLKKHYLINKIGAI